MSDHTLLRAMPTAEANPDGPFLVSMAVLLSGRQCTALAAFAAAIALFTPSVWKRLEPLDREPDYRIPYALSNDYWLFARIARDAASRYQTLVLGDSVIWGQYVTREQTLTHWLNEKAGRERFANLGVDGMHPAALAGLLEHYAGGIEGKEVVIHCNPLWLTSPKHDLQEDAEFSFNHPALVPQFFPSIPCYRQGVSKRIGIVVERNVPLLQWVNHLQQAYFGQTSIPEWSLDHPYENPVQSVTLHLPPSDNRLRHRPVPWTEAGIRKQDFAWVDLETSFQWRSFRRALEALAARQCPTLVLVGPFNEHLLTDEGRRRYERVRDGITAWLSEHGVAYELPPTLPSELYADASHPLDMGYRQLAEMIYPRLSRE